jgi:site-specific recombinase XerD
MGNRFEFQQYLSKFEDKADNTISSYATALKKVSKLLSFKTGKKVDIYEINDLEVLKNIRKEFDEGGILYSYYLTGTTRNVDLQSLKAYIRFMSITILGTIPDADLK